MIINGLNLLHTKSVIRLNFFNTLQNKPQLINFSGNDSFERRKENFDDKFLSQIEYKYPNKNINEVIYNSINDQNLLGKGTFAKVYEIPKVDNLVIRIEHKTPTESIFEHPILPVKDEFPDSNFGQKIADNLNGITILKRVYGEVHGFTNPSEKDDDAKFLPEHAELVLSQIEELAQFPLESYENFALKIIKLNENPRFRLDFANANNLLIDKKNKEINIVDLSANSDVYELKDCLQDSSDMISLLLNAVFHKKIYDKLPSQSQKESLIENSRIIIEKVRQATQNVGLGNDKYSGRDKLGKLNDYCIRVINKDCDFLNRYDAFHELYADILD